MLKGINPAISPELLKILCEMGHGDELVVTDAHYPAHSMSSGRVVRADGVPAVTLLEGIAQLIQLDDYEIPCAMIKVRKGDMADPDVEKSYRKALGYTGKIEQVERFKFYARAKKAYAVLHTGELRKYGCIIIKKGVTPVAVNEMSKKPKKSVRK